MKYLIATIKILFGLLGLTAVAVNIYIQSKANVFNFIEFYSYFTNLSNTFAGIVLLISAYYTLSDRDAPRIFEYLRGAATLYMIITGIVYTVLLSGIPITDRSTYLEWTNQVLHHIMPIYLAIDWLIFKVRRPLSIKRALLWLVFPILYVIYSLARGAATGFYPYPFLNPVNGGYGAVAIMTLYITIGFTIGTVLLSGYTKLSRINK